MFDFCINYVITVLIVLYLSLLKLRMKFKVNKEEINETIKKGANKGQ